MLIPKLERAFDHEMPYRTASIAQLIVAVVCGFHVFASGKHDFSNTCTMELRAGYQSREGDQANRKGGTRDRQKIVIVRCFLNDLAFRMAKAQKSKRDCPSVGRQISAAECGSGRGSLYACPETCPFSPFTSSNYDQLLAIESNLIRKTMAFREKEKSKSHSKDSWEDLLRAGARDSGMVIHSKIVWEIYWERDSSGSTLAERWLADQNADLKNDERVLLSFSSRVRPVLYQIHRLIDAQTTQGVDLITGEVLRIVDRSAAAIACRYDVVFGWMYPMPHFSRLSGSAVNFPEVADLEPETVLREIASHLGAPAETDALIQWLAKHFSRVVDAATAVSAARWAETMKKMDCQIIRTDYRVQNRPALIKKFQNHRNMLEEDPNNEDLREGFNDAFVCLVAEDAEADQLKLSFADRDRVSMGRPVLGRILMGAERARIEANSAVGHQSLKAQFEKLAGSFTEFLREHRIDLVEQMLSRKSASHDPSLVPPKLLGNTSQIVLSTDLLPNDPDKQQRTALDAYAAMYENFIDNPIPALDGQTPRCASKKPLLRGRLLRLMQTHIRNCDQKRREEGVDIDLNPLLRELGLDELVSEPPPLGVKKTEPRRENSQDDLFAEPVLDEEDAGVFPTSSSSHQLPKPPRRVLSIKEVDERSVAMLKRYPTFEEAGDAVEGIFPGVLDFTFGLLENSVGEAASSFAAILVSRACIVMAGSQHPALHLDFAEIDRRLREDLSKVSKIADLSGNRKHAAFEKWIAESPQPNLMLSLVGLMMDTSEGVSKKHRVSSEKQFVIFSFIKSLILELSRALG